MNLPKYSDQLVSTHIRNSLRWTEGVYWPCSKA